MARPKCQQPLTLCPALLCSLGANFLDEPAKAMLRQAAQQGLTLEL